MNLNIMDLEAKKKELLSQKEKLEQVKSDAHKGIIAINVKLRKLEAVTRDAEELFDGFRTAKEDMVIDGIEVKKGEKIFVKD